METIIGLLFSKIGGILAGVLGVLGLYLWGKWQKGKREQAETRADSAEAVAGAHEDIREIERETKKENARIDGLDVGGVVESFNRLYIGPGDKPPPES